MKIARVAVVSLMILGFLVLSCCDNVQKLEFKTPYQVVFLDNNNAYIGKLQQTGKDFVHLTSVYYIRSQINPETKQVANTLLRRGYELHQPNLMYINTRHIVMIEPVTPGSQVAKLIEQSEAQQK
jgi:hypothetical protein